MTRKREIMRVERTKEEEMMRRALRFVLPQATQNVDVEKTFTERDKPRKKSTRPSSSSAGF